uniref:HMA domain-containing protein n=1 Tax=Aegilops tauschii subsp. strangulata TaxID=200361 RepID=A0A453M935_AEGTS
RKPEPRPRLSHRALSLSFCRAIKLRSRANLPCEELRSSVAGSPIKPFSLAPSLHSAHCTAPLSKIAQLSAAPLAAELGWTGDTVARYRAMAPLLFKDMRSLSCSSPASTAICPSLERQPIFRPQKAGVSPLFQVPAEPRAHRQDGRKGQHHHHHHRAGVANGELASPAGSTRFLLSGCAAVDEIQEVATATAAPPAAAPGGDVRREEPAAVDVKNTNTNTQEQVVVLKVSLHCKACAGKVKKHLAKMEGEHRKLFLQVQ